MATKPSILPHRCHNKKLVSVQRSHTTGTAHLFHQDFDLPLTDLSHAMSSGQLQKVPFAQTAAVTGELRLKPDEYVLIPCTFEPLASSAELPFKLSAWTNDGHSGLSLCPVNYSALHFIRCHGSWVAPPSVPIDNAQLAIAARARFSLICEHDSHVQVWLSSNDRLGNQEPSIHLWRFKTKEKIEMHRANGEVKCSFVMQAGTPYFLSPTSTSPTLLGPFQLLISSDQAIEVAEHYIANVPSSVDAFVHPSAAPKNTTPQKLPITQSRLSSLGFSDSDFAATPGSRISSSFSVPSSPSVPSQFDNSAVPPSRALAPAFVAPIVPSTVHQFGSFGEDDDIPPPPPPPCGEEEWGEHSSSGIEKGTPPSPPQTPIKPPPTPMSRGRIIDSYLETSLLTSSASSSSDSSQLLVAASPLVSVSSPSLPPHATSPKPNSPNPLLSHTMIRKIGADSSLIEPIKMPTLPTLVHPRPPSVSLPAPGGATTALPRVNSMTFAAGTSSLLSSDLASNGSRGIPLPGLIGTSAVLSSTDSHAMQFSMESTTAPSSVVSSLASAAIVDSQHRLSLSELQLIPQDSLSCQVRFSWTKATAGGNARQSTRWRNNQQWVLDITKAAAVTVVLTQLGNTPPVSVGVYVLRAAADGPLKRVMIDEEDQKATSFEDEPMYVRQLLLPIGRYVLIPCTEYAGIEREAILSVKSSEVGELSVQSIPDTWTCLTENGEWTKKTAGGCWTELAWLKNPQYQLTFKRGASVMISLSLQQPMSTSVGFYVVRNTHGTFKTVLEITPENLLFPPQFRQRAEVWRSVEGKDGDVFNIIPATFQAQCFGQFNLSIFSPGPELVTLEDVGRYTEKASYKAHWEANSAGGTFDHPSWRYNLQLHVSWPWRGNMQVGILLTQYPRPIEAPASDQASSSSEASTSSSFPQHTADTSSSWSQIVISSQPDLGTGDDAGIEPFGFYTYPLEDALVKRVSIDRSELLMNPVFGSSRRVAGLLNAKIAQPLIVDAEGQAHIVINPFTVSQYIQRATNYEVRVVIQSDVPSSYPGEFKPVMGPIVHPRPGFTHRGEWVAPLVSNVVSEVSSSHTSKITYKDPAMAAMAAKLSRAEIRKYQILEPNTLLTILLIQKSFGLGQIHVYKIGMSSTSNSSLKTSVERREEEVSILLNHSTLVHQSRVSRSHENLLKCMIIEPGFYSICAVPEVEESVGPVLLVVHYWKNLKDLNLDLATSAERAAKRLLVIQEIVDTERAYVRNLRILCEHFMPQLLAQSVKIGVDVEMVKKIFSNIPTLLNCNGAFYEQLCSVEPRNLMVGKIFLDFCTFFRMYAEYTNHFDENCRILQTLKQKSSFKNALEKLEMDPRVHNLNFNDFHITPVQRIMRYALLLEQLLRYTDETHADYQSLVQSVDRVKSVAFDINEKKRRAEAESQVVAIQNMIYFTKSTEHPIIAVPARLFLRAGRCSLIHVAREGEHSPPTPSKRKHAFKNGTSSGSSSSAALQAGIPSMELAYQADYVFLFNDLLVLTKEKKPGKKYTWKYQIPLTSDSDVSTQGEKLICLRTPITTSVTITFFLEVNSLRERELWVSELSVIIQVLVNAMHNKLASKVVSNWKVLDSKMQMLLPS